MNGTYGQLGMNDIFDKIKIRNSNSKASNDENITFSHDLDNGQAIYISHRISQGPENKQMPIQIACQVLSYSKTIMNRAMREIKAFDYPRVYYTDTDSMFVNMKWEEYLSERTFPQVYYDENGQRKTKHIPFIGADLGQFKNDMGGKYILYGCFPATKTRFTIMLSPDGKLSHENKWKGMVKSELCKTSKKFQWNVKFTDISDETYKKLKEHEVGPDWFHSRIISLTV